MQESWHGIEIDEESTEEQNWNGCDWAKKYGYLLTIQNILLHDWSSQGNWDQE